MTQNIGGFRTTGVWVLLRYGMAGLVAVVILVPSVRHSVVNRVMAGVAATALTRVPGLSAMFGASGASHAPADAAGRSLSFGRPAVTEDTPRVRLADLPASSTPVSVRLSDLPQPSAPIAYSLTTRSTRRPPQVITSPRPRPMPVAGTAAPVPREPLICRVLPARCI